MANKPYIGYNKRRQHAKRRYHLKIGLTHAVTGVDAIVELKVWDVPRSIEYPGGIKFSFFLVLKQSVQVVVGMDNHFPKGPHLHIWNEELPYVFVSLEQLNLDFWSYVAQEGFVI